MKAWQTQYEVAIQYAVQQLAKTRGMDADWRMSAAIFHEAEEKHYQYRIQLYLAGNKKPVHTTINATNIEGALGRFRETMGPDYDYEKVKELTMGQKFRVVHAGPAKVKTNHYVTVERISNI